MFTDSLTASEFNRRPSFAAAMTAEFSGYARAGNGEAGSLYRASNGLTYFVPHIRLGNQTLAVIDQAEEVISNPTGFYDDMLFISVSPHLMARGLRAALLAASQTQEDEDDIYVA